MTPEMWRDLTDVADIWMIVVGALFLFLFVELVRWAARP